MISQKGLRDFMARPMRDSSTAKSLPEDTLDRMVAKQGLEFETPPRRAQKVCTLLGWRYPSYLFLLGMGGGKSKISLDLFANRKRIGQVSRLLVLVPNVVNLGAWEIEVSKHAPNLVAACLDQSGSSARWATIESSADIVVATYAGLATLVCGKQDNGKGQNKMKPDANSLKRMANAFDMLVLDECTAIKNSNSLWFRIIRSLRKSIGFCYGLTGTPFDKNPIDLWSQFFVIDEGYTLGETLGLYRAAFFRQERGYFGGAEYHFKRKLKLPLARRLGNCSVRYSEAECQDLPPAVGGLGGDLMTVPVALPSEQRPYYDKVATELADSRKNLTLVEAAYTRMRMICSGWLGAKTDDGERVEIKFRQNPKFDAVLDLLQQIPSNEKVIIVCWFQATCRMMMEALAGAKHSAVLINGETTATAKRRAMDEFCNGKPRVLVASTAISKGVNLQGASRFMIFVESPDSTIERSQMEARIRREGGIKGTRYYYDITVKSSVDERILQALTEGRKLHEVLVDRRR
tara:strand:+ start:4683 stop:6236 length:1554 start_codon:yes stop_codon:yes gene_type:complete